MPLPGSASTCCSIVFLICDAVYLARALSLMRFGEELLQGGGCGPGHMGWAGTATWHKPTKVTQTRCCMGEG